jgi:hypothetical protein
MCCRAKKRRVVAWRRSQKREGGRQRRAGDGERGNDGHGIDVEMAAASSGIGTVCMGTCTQCTETREVWTKRSLQYVCTVVRSARTHRRPPLQEEPVVGRRVRRRENTRAQTKWRHSHLTDIPIHVFAMSLGRLTSGKGEKSKARSVQYAAAVVSSIPTCGRAVRCGAKTCTHAKEVGGLSPHGCTNSHVSAVSSVLTRARDQCGVVQRHTEKKGLLPHEYPSSNSFFSAIPMGRQTTDGPKGDSVAIRGFSNSP